MADIASFSVARDSGQLVNANRLADPENIYIPGFKGIMEKNKIKSKKTKFSRQVAAILIIGGKLKNLIR